MTKKSTVTMEIEVTLQMNMLRTDAAELMLHILRVLYNQKLTPAAKNKVLPFWRAISEEPIPNTAAWSEAVLYFVQNVPHDMVLHMLPIISITKSVKHAQAIQQLQELTDSLSLAESTCADTPLYFLKERGYASFLTSFIQNPQCGGMEKWERFVKGWEPKQNSQKAKDQLEKEAGYSEEEIENAIIMLQKAGYKVSPTLSWET